MTTRRFLLVPLTLVAALGGCEVLEQVQRTAVDFSAHSKFKGQSKLVLRSGPTGMHFVLRVESTEETHWYDAMHAMSLIDGGRCPDGGPYSIDFMKPELDSEALVGLEYVCSDGLPSDRSL